MASTIFVMLFTSNPTLWSCFALKEKREKKSELSEFPRKEKMWLLIAF